MEEGFVFWGVFVFSLPLSPFTSPLIDFPLPRLLRIDSSDENLMWT